MALLTEVVNVNGAPTPVARERAQREPWVFDPKCGCDLCRQHRRPEDGESVSVPTKIKGRA